MISVLFVVGRYFEEFDKEFGGTTREYHAIVNAFKDNDYVDFHLHINENIEKTIDLMDDYDVVHVDDNYVIREMLKRGLRPDVIGPTARSPTKKESVKKEWIKDGINIEDYYKAIVVRNNNSEERIDGYWDKIRYIGLGVDTDELVADDCSTKRWILWAGDVTREAKNFQMFMEIMKITELPMGYDWKVMSSYKLKDYIDTLKHTALNINTSTNETFCFAMFEANALGVPTIYKRGLHNPAGHKQQLEFHKNKPIQVEYTPESYSKKILELLGDKNKLYKERINARRYTEENGSYKNIVDSFTEVYIDACKNKYGEECFKYG